MDSRALAAFNLGNDLLQQQRLDEAVVAYRRAIEIAPVFADAYNNLGVALRRQGDLDAARACHEKALADAPGHASALINLGQLQFLRAQLGLEPLPLAASGNFVASLYNGRANDWDRSAAHLQKYCAPQLVADAMKTYWKREAAARVLDAGCGTGLVGELIKDLAVGLDGVDLSPAMLERATSKGIYQNLFQGDIVQFMADHPSKYDAVVSAATLIHFGDLKPVFGAAFGSLRGGGLFIFTLFPFEGVEGDFSIAPSDVLRLMGCFAHSERYVRETVVASGFSVECLDLVTHEYFDRQPVPGLLGVLRK